MSGNGGREGSLKRKRLDVPESQATAAGGRGRHAYGTRSKSGGRVADAVPRGGLADHLTANDAALAFDAHGRTGAARVRETGYGRATVPDPATSRYASHELLKHKASPPRRPDDKDGHYTYKIGENLTRRYKVMSHLGEGTFGIVVECWDRLTRDYCAVKIIRNVPKYKKAAMFELAVLNTINKSDPTGKWHCVQLKEWFEYRSHICMVFDKLGHTLFDLLRKNGYRPFDLYHVQRFTKQLLESASFLHGLELIHTDLKPENILLANHAYHKVEVKAGERKGRRVPDRSDIFVIDFGSATFEDQHHSDVVSTRHYRAPEVILGLGWSFPCDMWSIGCILVELVTGEALFKTHDDLEHLAMMQRVLGPIPGHMACRAGPKARHLFCPRREAIEEGGKEGGKDDRGGRGGGERGVGGVGGEGMQAATANLAWPGAAEGFSADGVRDSLTAVNELKSLKRLVSDACDVSVHPEALESLVDLLAGLLRIDPEWRMTTTKALQHAFLSVDVAHPNVAAAS